MKYFLDTNIIFHKNKIVKYLNGEMEFKINKNVLASLEDRNSYIPRLVISEVKRQLSNFSGMFLKNRLLSKEDKEKYASQHKEIINTILTKLNKFVNGHKVDIIPWIDREYIDKLSSKTGVISDSKDLLIAAEVTSIVNFYRMDCFLVTDNRRDFKSNDYWKRMSQMDYLENIASQEKIRFKDGEGLTIWIMEKVFEEFSEQEIEQSDGFQNYWGWNDFDGVIEIDTNNEDYTFSNVITIGSEEWKDVWELIEYLKVEVRQTIEYNKRRKLQIQLQNNPA